MTESLDWTIVDRAAEALGVTKDSLKKWRQRGVPHRWRIPLIRQTGGIIAAEQFDAVTKIKDLRGRHAKPVPPARKRRVS
jgi:hypothetical protein